MKRSLNATMYICNSETDYSIINAEYYNKLDKWCLMRELLNIIKHCCMEAGTTVPSEEDEAGVIFSASVSWQMSSQQGNLNMYVNVGASFPPKVSADRCFASTDPPCHCVDLFLDQTCCFPVRLFYSGCILECFLNIINPNRCFVIVIVRFLLLDLGQCFFLVVPGSRCMS